MMGLLDLETGGGLFLILFFEFLFELLYFLMEDINLASRLSLRECNPGLDHPDLLLQLALSLQRLLISLAQLLNPHPQTLDLHFQPLIHFPVNPLMGLRLAAEALDNIPDIVEGGLVIDRRSDLGDVFESAEHVLLAGLFLELLEELDPDAIGDRALDVEQP
jgi:hypothetical protein